MEKIWDELKKIEAQADLIRGESQDKAKKMTDLATKEAEELMANSTNYADEDAQHLYQITTREANQNRDELLKANLVAADKLRLHAEKHMKPAIEKIVNAVIEEA
jgi:vacuolar-type H+-ATPase subunit H